MGSAEPNAWLRILPRLGIKPEALGDILARSPWFILEAWGGERLRLYLSSPLGESVLRRVVGVRREEPPPLDGMYRVELQSEEYWVANPPLEWETVYEFLQGRDAALQVAAVLDPKTIKVLLGKAKAVRGGGRSSLALQVMEVFEEAFGQDPARRYRLERYRRDPAEEELRRRQAQDIIARTRQGPLYVVRIRAYARDKHLARELGELVALRFTRPLRVKSPLIGGRVKDSSRERRIWKPAGLLGSPPAVYPWLTQEEVKRLLVLPDPSVYRVEFERGTPLPSVVPPRRDIRLGVLPDGREFRVDVEDLYRHAYVIGRTGAGKSTLLLNLSLRLWRTGRAAVFVIDPHGDLARDIVEAAPSLERVYYLDAGGRDFAVNPLELPRIGDPELARSLAVDNTVAVLEKVLRLPETAVNVKFIVRTLLHAMYRRGATPTFEDLYKAILALRAGTLDLDVDDPEWRVQVELLQKLPEQSIVSSLVRLQPFHTHPLLRELTRATTLPVDRLTRERALVAIAVPKALGEDFSELLTSVILMKLWFYALERALRGEERTPIFVVVDEFQNVSGLPVIETILSEARKYGLHIIAAHQHLKQLPPELLQSLLANTAVKIVFSVGGETSTGSQR